MNPWQQAREIAQKEIREVLRDRRTLAWMVGVPVLLYPVLFILMQQLALLGVRQLSRDPIRTVLVAEAGTPSPTQQTPLVRYLEEAEEVDLYRGFEGDTAAFLPSEPAQLLLRTRAVDAVVRLFPAGEGNQEAVILYDASSERSQRARGVLVQALRAWGDTLLARRLEVQGLPLDFAAPLVVADSSVATARDVGGYAAGRFLPMLLVIITLLGTFYPAIDLAAGEKERGTLETILTAPVSGGAVVVGKFITVALVGVAAAGLNLASMILTFRAGLFQFAPEFDLDLTLSTRTVGILFLTLVPLAVLFGALFLGVAVRSRSFKEAQNSLTPVYMLAIVPAILPTFPGIDLTMGLAITPVAGVSLFFRDLISGSADPLLGWFVLLSTVAYASLALAFAAISFGREDVLFGVDDPTAQGISDEELFEGADETRAPRLPGAGATAWFLGGMAVLFFYGSTYLTRTLGEAGMLVTEWGLLFLPAILFIWIRGYDLRETLSLRRPTGLALFGGTLVAVGGIPVAWLLAWLQSFVLPIPWELVEGLSGLVIAEDPLRLLWLLVLVALTPAVAEEVVFRGVLLSGTLREARRQPRIPWFAIVLNGVLFGLFHVSFETAFRFLPTAWLGMVLALAVWRSGSIWVGVAMHFLNNGAIVVMASSPFLREKLADPEAAPPAGVILAGILLLAFGFRVLFSSPRPVSAHPSPSSGRPPAVEPQPEMDPHA